MRAMKERLTVLAASFPKENLAVSVLDASMIMVLTHCGEVCVQWNESIDYIESMIREKLIAAIGQKVSPTEFAEYMRFHNRKLFADDYMPSPFCFAVRRSEKHSPEGTVSLEGSSVGSSAQPIVTLSSCSNGSHGM